MSDFRSFLKRPVNSVFGIGEPTRMVDGVSYMVNNLGVAEVDIVTNQAKIDFFAAVAGTMETAIGDSSKLDTGSLETISEMLNSLRQMTDDKITELGAGLWMHNRAFQAVLVGVRYDRDWNHIKVRRELIAVSKDVPGTVDVRFVNFIIRIPKETNMTMYNSRKIQHVTEEIAMPREGGFRTIMHNGVSGEYSPLAKINTKVLSDVYVRALVKRAQSFHNQETVNELYDAVVKPIIEDSLPPGDKHLSFKGAITGMDIKVGRGVTIIHATAFWNFIYPTHGLTGIYRDLSIEVVMEAEEDRMVFDTPQYR